MYYSFQICLHFKSEKEKEIYENFSFNQVHLIFI